MSEQPQSNPLEIIRREINGRSSVIESALPAGVALSVERVKVSAMLAIRKSPALQSCDPGSIVESVVAAAQLGVDPGGALGEGYLVPYKGRCQLILGYQGMISIARRSGEVRTIEAHAVHQNDVFRFALGTSPVLVHEPVVFGDRGPLLGVYAMARLSDGSMQAEVMGVPEVQTIRARSAAAKSGRESPWDTDFAEMAKKTAIRRLFKRLPKSLAMMQAIEHDNDTDGVVDVTSRPTRTSDPDAAIRAGMVRPVSTPAEATPTQAQQTDIEARRDRLLAKAEALCNADALSVFASRIHGAARAGDAAALDLVARDLAELE